jgi:lysophospholipase L1-like esterase
VRLFGVNMERDTPGVVIDAMGVSGRTASSWLRWDEPLMDAYLERRKPDIAVLAYGTNEANDRKLTEAEYRETLRSVLTRMRRRLPDTPCVLIGPSDRARKIKGTTYAIWGPTAGIARIQREIGPEFGCVTWDLQEATGGPGSMLRWFSAKLTAPDLIHFSAGGYQELARRFVAALDGTSAK